MKQTKNFFKKILFPSPWVIFLLVPVSAVALITVFVKGWEDTPASYVVYAVSAYTVTVLTVFLAVTLPVYHKRIKQKIYDHPLGNRYMTDAAFRVRVSLYTSLGINLAYSVFKLLMGVVYSSTWWGAIAIYYMVLSLLRFVLLRYMRADENSSRGLAAEYRRYRLCGILMLILNLSLTGIVFMMVWQNKAYSYPGTLIFAAAAYTFYTVTISIIDVIQYRKYHSPILSASKAIRFAAALVSLLSLETAMLAQFGEDPIFSRRMTAFTGAGVCILVLTVSVYMIVSASVQIKKHNQGERRSCHGQ